MRRIAVHSHSSYVVSKLTDMMVYLNTDKSTFWVKTILAQMEIEHIIILQIVEGDYEVNIAAKKLQKLYEQYVKNN